MPLAEYRFFSIRGHDDSIKMLGCRYLPDTSPDVPPEALVYATERANEIFDVMTVGNSFVLDVGYSNGKYSIIEVNSWESSSFYCLDPKLILEMITQL